MKLWMALLLIATPAAAQQKATLLDQAELSWRCWTEKERAKTLGEIRSQHKYAKIGGAVDLEELYALQQELKMLDGLLAQIVAAQRERGPRQPSPPCSHPKIQETMACIGSRNRIPPSAGWRWPTHLPDQCRTKAILKMLIIYCLPDSVCPKADEVLQSIESLSESP